MCLRKSEENPQSAAHQEETGRNLANVPPTAPTPHRPVDFPTSARACCRNKSWVIGLGWHICRTELARKISLSYEHSYEKCSEIFLEIVELYLWVRKNPAKSPPNFPQIFLTNKIDRHSPTSFCRGAGRTWGEFSDHWLTSAEFNGLEGAAVLNHLLLRWSDECQPPYASRSVTSRTWSATLLVHPFTKTLGLRALQISLEILTE